jgi:hypothetical protein
MHGRHVLVIASVLASLSPLAAGAAVTAWTSVTVRVYDGAMLPDATRHAALAVAGRTVSAASVEVTWVICPGDGALSTPCTVPVKGRELVVRILRSLGPEDASHLRPLGEALVDARAGAGVLATIYFDRVVALATAARSDMPTLLGRAIAHEMGHLLLATSAHTRHGLMRAIWSRHELHRDRHADWSFTPADLETLRVRARSGAAAEDVAWGNAKPSRQSVRSD